MQVKKQQLEPDLEPQTSSKLGQEYVKTVYCHPAYLTSIRIFHVKWVQLYDNLTMLWHCPSLGLE